MNSTMDSPDKHAPADGTSAMSRLLDRPALAATIAQATKSAAQARSLQREPQENLLMLRCQCEWFGIPAEAVVHVCPVTSVHAIPHRTVRGLRGLTVISGAIVPAFDLAALLGIAVSPAAPTSKPRMVTIGSADEPWAFEADEVPGVFMVAKSAIKPLPVTVEQSPRRVSCGLVATTHGTATLIDTQRLLAEFRGVLE